MLASKVEIVQQNSRLISLDWDAVSTSLGCCHKESRGSGYKGKTREMSWNYERSWTIRTAPRIGPLRRWLQTAGLGTVLEWYQSIFFAELVQTQIFASENQDNQSASKHNHCEGRSAGRSKAFWGKAVLHWKHPDMITVSICVTLLALDMELTFACTRSGMAEEFETKWHHFFESCTLSRKGSMEWKITGEYRL